MKLPPTNTENVPIYIPKELKSNRQSRNKNELSSLLPKARNLFIDTDNKWEHASLTKMRSMMGNDTIYQHMNFKRDLIILLVCAFVLYLVALVWSTLLNIPLNSFYDVVFHYFFHGK